jgi:Family of unknown function (DUF6200)
MAVTIESTKTATEPHSGNAPVVVDLGKKRRKLIKQLREGRGKLMDEINTLVDELRSAGTISAGAQPVIVVVEKKPKSPSLLWPIS